jgi:hypothetical protein
MSWYGRKASFPLPISLSLCTPIRLDRRLDNRQAPVISSPETCISLTGAGREAVGATGGDLTHCSDGAIGKGVSLHCDRKETSRLLF